MVKGKQRNVRVFEFEPCEEEALREYIERNQILLQGFLILFAQDISDSLKTFLCEQKLLFMDAKFFDPIKRTTRAKKPDKHVPVPNEQADSSENQQESLTQDFAKTLFVNRIIRSGEELYSEGDVVIYGRINSGAKIYAKGNLQIYGEVDGVVESEGDFMILTKIGQGSVFFDGEFLDPDLFKGEKKIIFKNQESFIIKEA